MRSPSSSYSGLARRLTVGPWYLCLEMLDRRLRLWLLSMLVATFVFGLGYGLAVAARLIPV
jgi:hypothetical protein